MPPETGCCSPAERATCCEPEAQEACCGEGHGSGCGCAAGHAGPVPTEDVHTVVRERYAEAARAALAGAACGCGEGSCRGEAAEVAFGGGLYEEAMRAELPEGAVLASLGCGNPVAVAELREGETVLDLGSGGGIDVLLSARRVGSTGKAYGLDMTDEMLALARRNAREAGVTNVELLRGRIEDIPLPAETVDVVISNCVVNLSPDKAAVLREVFRVLTPGGRIGISDVVAEDRLGADDRAERGSWSGCLAGALAVGEYRALLAEAGFRDASVTLTHEVADGLHGAIVRATKPARE
jgi:arsenite methyltransferase